MEENKKSKLGLGILIGVLVTLVIGLSVFIIYDKVLSNDDNQSEVNESNNNSNDSSNENDMTSSDFDISKFDTTKEAINGPSGFGYELVTNDNSASSVGLSISLNENKRSATITIDWSKYGSIYGTSSWMNVVNEYEVTNFTKNIKEVYIGGFGQTSGDETAFYIMEDGTVEYTPIEHALGNNGSSSETILKSYGEFENVSEVVKVVTASDYPINSEYATSGAYHILGIKTDGTFYNLSSILYAKNY